MKKYELAKDDYEKGLKYREIAEKYGVSISTVKSWKSRYWSQEKVATKDATTPNNKGAPDNNKNAVTHGLFANWLPSETLEIMNEVAISKPEDILWNNIMIQYTAIIRAQKIMYVSGSDDLSKEEVGWSSGKNSSSERYGLQYAWDKQANFMNAQSRAMGTLASLIRQFVSIADEHDERRKKLELMEVQVNLAKAQLKQLDDGYDSSEEQTVIIDDIPLVESEAGSNGIDGQETNSN
ncbi:helix-turn-helix domain-containing protein [Enterococcus faecium]|nr:helix-turn-helix domain-containing protein [Enterococcus faecium]